jgi:hypothetical protein
MPQSLKPMDQSLKSTSWDLTIWGFLPIIALWLRRKYSLGCGVSGSVSVAIAGTMSRLWLLI